MGKLEQHEVDALERRCGHGGIQNDQSTNWFFQHALAHPEANGERFESIEAKLDELRSYLYANREISQGIRRSVSERRAYFDRPCGEHRQSIDQLAHVQEAPNGMEPNRSPAIASRENSDYQRATGPLYRASFSTGGYRRLAPRFLPVSNKGHRDKSRYSHEPNSAVHRDAGEKREAASMIGLNLFSKRAR